MSATYTTRLRNARPSSRTPFPVGTRLVVVGNGMVGARFAAALVEHGLHQPLAVTILGDEPIPAYDRIRLSSYADHRSREKLVLHPAGWYERHGLDLRTGTRVTAIDRDSRALTLHDGSELGYDALVFATGSRSFIPSIPGARLPGVFPYRNLADLDAIMAAARGKRSALVIGGGLLGLEAAQTVGNLGLRPTVLERGRFLLSRQLNETGASLLRRTIESFGLDLLFGRNPATIESRPDGLAVTFEQGDPATADLVILAAGIRPNSELAATSGLSVGAEGGIVVDDHLETSDPAIFAIGECALFHGRIHGLAAPGYAMAEHLALRFTGAKIAPLPFPDHSTRLKMLGANVISIGAALDEGTRHEFHDGGRYRMLLTGPKGRLTGALGVGPWEDSGEVHARYLSQSRIRPAEIRCFLEGGNLSSAGKRTPVADWPADRIVCNCMGVTKGTLLNCLATCGGDPDRLAAATGASTVCGSCRPLLAELSGSEPNARPIGGRALLGVSAIALVAAITILLAPPPAMAESVESWRYQVDQLWRDKLIKQLTGYSLAGVFLIGLLLSLRKRFKWFRFGHFARWRVFHSVFGLLSLFVLFAHTGFRFGQNLNFWLMLTFVATNLLGAVTGIVAAIEARGATDAGLAARRWRPLLAWAHIILFWPLPVLLTFHILSAYLY